MKKFKRRSFVGSSSKLELQEEAPPLDLLKEPADNMKELLIEITRKDQIATGKRMGYLNNFAQLVRCVPPEADFGLTLAEILMCLRVAFVSPAKEIRAAALRALRHLLHTREQAKTVVSQRIDIFIARSLDLVPALEVERVQALRLVRKMVYLCAEEFPMTIAMSLAAISSDVSQNRDRMSRACLATLCELAVKNTELASYCGSFNVIISNILDCPVPRMNESLTVTLLYLFNHPNYRCYVRKNVGLEALLAPFTDFYYLHSSEIPDNLVAEDQKSRIDAARIALVTIFRSWSGIEDNEHFLLHWPLFQNLRNDLFDKLSEIPGLNLNDISSEELCEVLLFGIICMCDPEGSGLESLMGVFRLPNVDIRAGILETLYEVFCLQKPAKTTDFIEALNSCDPLAMQYSWKLSEGFVVAEALSLLTHRASENRTNLVKSYIALLLNAFIDADLLESLVEVITTSDEELSISATILLGELLHMANTILPPECSGSCSGITHCLPTLMSLATNPEVSSSKRGKASAAIGYLDQIHQVKKRGAIPCTLFLSQLLLQASQHQTKHLKSSRDKAEQMMLRETDEVLSAIKDSQVFSMSEFMGQWDWDLISAVLDSPKLSVKRQDDQTYLKFVRRLLQFYKPSNKQYCLIDVQNKCARKFSEIGLQLIDFLLRKDEQPEGERILLELVQEIADALTEATTTGLMTGVFCTSSIVDTLSRDYLLFIGRLSSTTLGTRCLEKASGVFQHLLEICSMISRECMLKLILASFDYGRDGIARVILAKALTASPLSCRLYSTKFMRVLLRAKTPYFSNWGMELLTNQLYDQDHEIIAEAIDVLQEACEDEANLQRLIEIRPSLLHLGEKGIILLIRYLSVSRGFTYLSEVDYVEPLLGAWKSSLNCEYVRWMENELAEALTSFKRQADDDNYIRRSASERMAKKDVFVIPHLYGELAQHRTGIKLIQEKGYLKDSINTLLDGKVETSKDVLDLKAALWALGHIGSTNWGIVLLSPSTRVFNLTENSVCENDSVLEDDSVDVIREIVILAQECEVLTVRGTCYYVLGLIAKTSQGADKLQELGWDCVRHKGVETWPVIEQEIAFLPEDYLTDEESDGPDLAEEEEEPSTNNTPGSVKARYGGVYLGDEVSDFPETVLSEAFEYTRITFGEDKKAKNKKRLDEDKQAEADEKRSLSDFKSRNFNVDDSGNFTEYSPSLMSGVERLVDSDSNLYLGNDDGSRSALQSDLLVTLTNLEKQQAMRHSNTEPNLSQAVKSTPKKEPFEQKPTRGIFGDGGIYLGEEVIEEPEDERKALLAGGMPKWMVPKSGEGDKDSNEQTAPANRILAGDNDILRPKDDREVLLAGGMPKWLTAKTEEKDTPVKDIVNNTRPPRVERMFSTEHQLDNLRPILEVDSRENIADAAQHYNAENINIEVEEIVIEPAGIDIEGSRERHRNGDYKESTSLQPDSLTSSLPYSSLTSENSSRLSPVEYSRGNLVFDPNYNSDKRARSLSFPIRKNSNPSMSFCRSVSFSAGNSENAALIGQCRSGSDPGMNGDFRAESYSSQDSDKEDKILGNRHRNFDKMYRKSNDNVFPDSSLKHGIRDRSDSDEQKIKGDYPDVSTASKRQRRVRGNTISPSASPVSLSYFESPAVASARDAFGYAAWTTLRKQRTFRKEIDLKVKQSSVATPYRQVLDRKGNKRGQNLSFRSNELSRAGRQVSVPASLYMMSRRHISTATSISSTGSDTYATPSTETTHNSEDYVGRCLPVNLYDILRLNPYNYKGSWADNFKPRSCENMSTSEEDFPHYESQCLRCMSLAKCPSKNSVKSGQRKSVEKREDKKILKSSISRTDSAFTKKKVSSSSLPPTEPDCEDRLMVNKEILRLVVNLSSSVASKASQQGLIVLKGKYPWAFEDLCIYSQMMDQLGTYTFRLTIRRFIQAMFENVNYQPLFQQADFVLGRSADK